MLAALFAAAPVRAQIFHDEDDGWCLWCFHRYGGDVNRPGWSPDRPYWHGDDAVPLSMRWQDLAAARAEAAAFDAAVAAETTVAPVGPPTRIDPRPRYARRGPVRTARPFKNCRPVLVRKD